MQDLRYAVRGFLGSPGFTAAAVISLALGVGANSAIFSVASALLLRPLPYADAERLVILWNRSPGRSWRLPCCSRLSPWRRATFPRGARRGSIRWSV